MGRTIYFVSPDGQGWKVQRVGAQKALKLFEQKQQAVDYAVQVARNNEPSQVRIQRRDGTIGEERTYGDDPYPPAG